MCPKIASEAISQHQIQLRGACPETPLAFRVELQVTQSNAILLPPGLYIMMHKLYIIVIEGQTCVDATSIQLTVLMPHQMVDQPYRQEKFPNYNIKLVVYISTLYSPFLTSNTSVFPEEVTRCVIVFP